MADHTTPHALDGILTRVLNGRDSLRQISISPYSAELGDAIACPRCNGIVAVVEYTSSYGKTVRYWSDCVCLSKAAAHSAALSAASSRYQTDVRVATTSDTRMLAAFTLESFDPARLSDGDKLVKAAR